MKTGTHHIRSQRWQVKTTSTAMAFAVRQELRTQLDARLLPAFERAFDAFATGDQVLHFPSLSLHLQVREGINLTADLTRLIEEQLLGALQATVRSAATSDGLQSPTAIAGEQPTRPVQAWSIADHRRELLLEYLMTGRIGWQAEAHQTIDVLTWLREEAELLASDLPVLKKVISGTVEARLAISFRLLQLLASSTRESILSQRATDSPVELITLLRQLASQQSLGSYLQLRAASTVLALDDAELAVVVTGISSAAISSGTFVGIIRELLAECSARLAAIENSDVGLANQIDSVLVCTNPFGSAQATVANAPIAAQKTLVEQPLVDDVARRVRAIEPRGATESPGLMVTDAGVILLHPFLPRLFECTKIIVPGVSGTALAAGEPTKSLEASLVQRDYSLSAAQLPRAAALLHWLVTGRNEILEFELALIKVLLGLALDDPLVVAEGLLTDSDRAEGEALLEAVVEHWTALRKTTVDGLRGSFLQRRGLLRENEREWYLRVESESFDMLLGQLPWGISFVKLPWMTKPIFTDWPTP